MNEKVNQHRPIPADLTPPVHHNSGNVRSTPAGGQVSTDQYRQPRDTKNGFDGPKGAAK
jgi:hypothetical protein